MPQTGNVRRTEEVLTDIIVAVEIKAEITLIIALIITPLIAVIAIATTNVLRLLGGKNILKRRINCRCFICSTRS